MGGLFRLIFAQPDIAPPPPSPPPAPRPITEDPAIKERREQARRAALRARSKRRLNPTGVLGDTTAPNVARQTLIGARRLGG